MRNLGSAMFRIPRSRRKRNADYKGTTEGASKEVSDPANLEWLYERRTISIPLGGIAVPR
jgi:hypothetical protein